MRRYSALLLAQSGKVKLVKMLDEKEVLAVRDFAWDYDQSYDLTIKVTGTICKGGLMASCF